ncbi:unnamed protein product [Lactuca virosa]|uniref:Uncharacterized protein n=1 Tax=Lactuca virosa TaxID=75947 RepID=A0AAU9NFX5_9ASTR|nr:unnamed protein product [Lactuca virosa]
MFFFANTRRNKVVFWGFHSSFRATQSGLSLNMDVSTTMIVKPGKVMDFLFENQNVRSLREIDWIKAKRMLKNLRIKTLPSNLEYKIIGLSEKTCREQRFSLKQKNQRDGYSPSEAIDITVFQYYAEYRQIHLEYSADCPCLDVGKPKRPVYIPLELCDLISLQRYTKALSNLLRASLVEKSRQKPRDRMQALTGALNQSNYGADPLINATGITISTTFTQVEGRVLEPPKLKFGRGGDMVPRGGRWNFNNKTLVEPSRISCWVVVNFSARCDLNALKNNLRVCSQAKGIELDPPFGVIEENPQFKRSPAPVRVDKMFEAIRQRLPGPPSFILCILPERKNSDIYGPWKRKCLVDHGIVTQCIAPTKINDQYVTNMLLKINAKMGGINSLLSVELSNAIPLVSRNPTIIFGMDVSHGSPGRADVPSIAAVVSSRKWPQISRYRASVRAQSARVEMIDGLFKPISHDKDEGMIRELLDDFYLSTPKLKPKNIIIFRDGVSESQFITRNSSKPIQKLMSHQEQSLIIKFVILRATTSIYVHKMDRLELRDLRIHQVLRDEIGFSADELQELVHSLSYVYQRSTTAISVVAPICYAHLAAGQVAQFVKFDDMSDTASSHSGGGVGGSSFTQLPKLHDKVSSSMFFC